MESVKSPNPNYLLIKYLINYYNDNSSNFSKFKIWQAGEFFTFSENPNDILQTHYLGETKTKPPFDEYFFIEYRNELSFNDFSRIRRFTLSVATQKIIIENFNKESFRTYDEIKNMIGIISIFSKGTDFFDLIIKRINNDLLFEIWSFKKVYIDYDNKAFSLVFPKNKDFMLPDNILEQKANEININQIRRISIIDINKNETISRILTKKILDKNINSENILDFVESASYLDEVNQRKLLFLFINSNDNINWEILIENKKLNILQNSFGQILAYSFEINEKLADNLSGIISLNSKIQFQNKITLLQNLSNHHLDNFVDTIGFCE